jgi:hypothetical protein
VRQPPANPFKVEEPEIEEVEDTVLPELPKLKEMPKPPDPDIPKLEDVIKGNGHNPDADEQLQEKAAEEKQAAEEEKELERMREEAEEAKIPGSGYLFNVKKKHLPEATRLNEREIFTFAVGAVQDYVLQRTEAKEAESVFEKFSNSIFRLKISAGGKGREENIAVRQVDAEEKANSARGSMNGI